MTRVPSLAVTRARGSAAMLASAAAGAIGVVFIVLMYGAFAVGAQGPGLVFGWINDVAVLVQYALAVPGVLAISAALRTDAPRLARIGTPFALAGIAVIVVFQALLVAGALSFEQEIGPAGLGFLVVGVWMIAAAVAGRRTGDAPVGPWMSLAGALYLGYPLWAYRVGRWMGTRAVSHETAVAPAADRA